MLNYMVEVCIPRVYVKSEFFVLLSDPRVMVMIVQVVELKSKIEEAQNEYNRLLAELQSLDVKEE